MLKKLKMFNILTNFHFLEFFIPSRRVSFFSDFSSAYIIALCISCSSGLLELQLRLSKNVFILLSFLKDIFTGYRIWSWQELLFPPAPALKDVMPMSFGHCFWQEVSYHFHSCFPVWNMSFVSPHEVRLCFQDFLLFVFSSLTIKY